MKTIVIAGFVGIGKTTTEKKYPNILDLESSDYHWTFLKEIQDVEKRKEINERIINRMWPNNYISAIQKNIGKYKYILVAGQLEIIKLLEKNKIDFIIVVPRSNLKLEYKKRCIMRGNNKAFVEKLLEGWDSYMKIISKYKNVIYLEKNQYLGDILFKI